MASSLAEHPGSRDSRRKIVTCEPSRPTSRPHDRSIASSTLNACHTAIHVLIAMLEVIARGADIRPGHMIFLARWESPPATSTDETQFHYVLPGLHSPRSSSSCSNVSTIPPFVLPEAMASSSASFEG